ncbi:hypothetical protein ACFOEE_07055 [Pseudoalteromonas fenneropenaei]|uniref:Uncharacterized protein n=1 Tax=Pseudoalteromonas fenneropenaei TaxID=1737459 RepID=A0ABV7CIB6_9GAMM
MTHAFQEFIRLLQAADKTQLTTFFAAQETKEKLAILKWLFNQA